MEDQKIIQENIDNLATFSNDTSLDFTGKFIETIFYLALFAAVAYFFLYLIKSGKLKIPAKFISKSLAMEGMDDSGKPYKFEIIQREIMPEGNELWVVKTATRHLLLSKAVTGGLSYLTDLNEKDLIDQKSLADV